MTGMIAVFALQRESVWCKLLCRSASATLELPVKTGRDLCVK